MLTLQPKSSLIDKITKIHVARLKPLQRITLRAKIVGDQNEVYASHAHYIADKDGEVDVCRDSSLGGSYSGVSPMGLLWSMKPAPGQRKGIRLMKSDVTKPYNVELKCFDDHISPNETPSQLLSNVTFQKWYMADGVKRIPVREGRIRGTLFIPAGDGPFPGVIDLFGGTGGLYEYRASLLASHGFATLALAYMGYDDLPEFPPTIDMEYFEEAANWLSNHPKVLPHGIGVHAACYGAWIALLMASLKMDPVKAIVAISPYIVAFPAPFTYKGKVSEIIHLENSKKLSTEEGQIWRHAIPTDTSYSPKVSDKYSAVTPVENISCPVLLIYGTGDLVCNADFQVKQTADRLKNHGKEHLCSTLCYPEAGHFIEPPYTPHCYASSSGPIGKWSGDPFLVWGGEKRSHAKAQEDSWPRILSFLQRNIPRVKCNL
ncbi:bile acid-CoA:amino acid N-acyltransferase-like [Oculina patagonica]